MTSARNMHVRQTHSFNGVCTLLFFTPLSSIIVANLAAPSRLPCRCCPPPERHRSGLYLYIDTE
jgi:hypothetical protein